MPRSASSRGSTRRSASSQQTAPLAPAIAETQERVQTPPRKRARQRASATSSSTSSNSATSRRSAGVPANAKLVELQTVLGSRGEYHMKQLVAKLVDRRRKNDGPSIVATAINLVLAGAGCKELVRVDDIGAGEESQGASAQAVEDLVHMVVESHESAEVSSPLSGQVALKQKLTLASTGRSGEDKSSATRLRHLRNFDCFFRTLYATLAGDGGDGLELVALLSSFLLGVIDGQATGPSLASIPLLEIRTVASSAACAGCSGLVEVIRTQEADIKHLEMTTPLGGRVPSRSAAQEMRNRLKAMMKVLEGMVTILSAERSRDSSEAIRGIVLSHSGFASWICALDDRSFSATAVAQLVTGLVDRSSIVRGMILQGIHRTLSLEASKTVTRHQLGSLAPHVLRRCFDEDITVRLWGVRCLNRIAAVGDSLDDDDEPVLTDRDFQLVSNLVWHPDLNLRMEAMRFVDAHVFGDPGVLRGTSPGGGPSDESTMPLLMIVEFIVQYGDQQETAELVFRVAEAIYRLSPSRRCHLCSFASYMTLFSPDEVLSQQLSQASTTPAEKSVLLALLSSTVRICKVDYSPSAISDALGKSWAETLLTAFRGSTTEMITTAELVRELACEGDVLDGGLVEMLESLLAETSDESLLSLTADLLKGHYSADGAPPFIAALRERCNELIDTPNNQKPLTEELYRAVALSKHWDVIQDDFSLLSSLLELADRRVSAVEANSALDGLPSPELVSLVLLFLTLTSLRRVRSGTAADEHKLCLSDLCMLFIGTVEHDAAEEAAGLRFLAFTLQLFLLDLIGDAAELRGDRSPADLDRILGDYVRELLLGASLPGPVKLLEQWAPTFNEIMALVVASYKGNSFDRRKAALLTCSIGLYCSRSDSILNGAVSSWLTRQVVEGSSQLSKEVLAALKYRRQHLVGPDQWKVHWRMLLNAVWQHAVSKNGLKSACKLSSTLCQSVGVRLQKGGHAELATVIRETVAASSGDERFITALKPWLSRGLLLRPEKVALAEWMLRRDTSDKFPDTPKASWQEAADVLTKGSAKRSSAAPANDPPLSQSSSSTSACRSL